VSYTDCDMRDVRAHFRPPLGEGEVMSGWYSDWQTAVAWLVVSAIAAVIYFGPTTRLIDFGN
jgi:hypothetical protein